MKKKYTKPRLSVEIFSLTQSIARDCSGSGALGDGTTATDPSQCVWNLGNGMSIFVAIANCTIDGDGGEFGCYNNPGEGNYAFRS